MKKFAVIFVSKLKPSALEYPAASARMVELAHTQEGFLSMESVRDAEGRGITVSYWSSVESIKKWKSHSEHREVQKRGREEWYESFDVKICEVI